METILEKVCAVQSAQARLLKGGKYKPTDEGGLGFRDLNPKPYVQCKAVSTVGGFRERIVIRRGCKEGSLKSDTQGSESKSQL